MMKIKMFFSTAIATIAAFSGLGATSATAQTMHAEIHGGWDRVTNEVREDSLLYGVGIGVDFRLAPRVTAGLQGNFDLSNGGRCEAGVIRPKDKLCIDVKRDISAVARIGYDVAPSTRLYALAGYTNARFGLDYTPPTGAATEVSGNADGLRLGAGLQHGLGGSVYTKAEYRYSNYEAGSERHQVIAGLGIAF